MGKSISSAIFAHQDHLLFTADVLVGNVDLGERLKPYHAGDMLVPLSHLGESVQNAVQAITQVHNR